VTYEQSLPKRMMVARSLSCPLIRGVSGGSVPNASGFKAKRLGVEAGAGCVA
jgi:hypothetical protein